MSLKCLFLLSDKLSVYKQKGEELSIIKHKGSNEYEGDIKEVLTWF